MLTPSVKTPLALEHSRSGPAGPPLEAVINWLEAQGYQPRRIPHLMRGVQRFSRWAQEAGCTLQALDVTALEAFGQPLHRLRRLRSPSGRYRHLFVGARTFVRFLEIRGLIAPAASLIPPPPPPELLGACRHWMRLHRGPTEASRNGYCPTLLALLDTLGEPPERFEAKPRRAFVLARTGHGGIGRAQTAVTAVRMFLRFGIAIGRCTPGLAHALPPMAPWRLASLPRSLPAATVARVVATCDLTTRPGVRDRAVRVLLARLGLRAGAVAAWQWDDIHGHDGTLGVAGKSRRATRLPLPQDVGEAMLAYGEHQRPHVPTAHVLLTTTAPLRPLSPQAVTAIAARALRHANVESPIHGAQVLRQAAATPRLRHGASLTSIGALLRHASGATTAHSAKVDVALLHEVARPWPEVPLG